MLVGHSGFSASHDKRTAMKYATQFIRTSQIWILYVFQGTRPRLCRHQGFWAWRGRGLYFSGSIPLRQCGIPALKGTGSLSLGHLRSRIPRWSFPEVMEIRVYSRIGCVGFGFPVWRGVILVNSEKNKWNGIFSMEPKESHQEDVHAPLQSSEPKWSTADSRHLKPFVTLFIHVSRYDLNGLTPWQKLFFKEQIIG